MQPLDESALTDITDPNDIFHVNEGSDDPEALETLED
jgi:hypothetical protein